MDLEFVRSKYFSKKCDYICPNNSVFLMLGESGNSVNARFYHEYLFYNKYYLNFYKDLINLPEYN